MMVSWRTGASGGRTVDWFVWHYKLDYLERAYDDAKHGRTSRQPYVEARCDEQNRLDVHVQYAPYGADCSKLGDTVLAMLSEHWGDAAPQEGELVWIGNWGDDERTAELHEFLLDPVEREVMSSLAPLVGGCGVGRPDFALAGG